MSTLKNKAFDKNRLRKLALCGIFFAIIIVMTFVPYTGYISTGLIAITTLHVIVIIGSVMLGWKYSIALGAMWGIMCVIRAATSGSAENILFINPLISVLPRLFVGLVAALVFKALYKTKLGVIGGCIGAAIAGTLTNTILVISAIYIFGGMIKEFKDAFEIVKTVMGIIISVNGAVELSVAVVLTPAIVRPLYPMLKKNGIMD